jgi:hypothetical protein
VPTGSCGWPRRPVVFSRIVPHVSAHTGEGQGLAGTKDIVIRCPNASCGRRLARVTAVLGGTGEVVRLVEGAVSRKVVPKSELRSLPPGKAGDSLVRVVDTGGRHGLPDDQVVVERATDPKGRGVGQPGPRTGYAENQRMPWYAPGDSVPNFDEPDTWAWHCPCGARPRISKVKLHQLVGATLRRGEHHLTLP